MFFCTGNRFSQISAHKKSLNFYGKKKARNNKKGNILWILPFCCYESARRGSNPRPPPWQGGAPPLSHSRINLCYKTPILNSQDNTPLEAGDGNRTHVSSLEGWCSTIELHPHIYEAVDAFVSLHVVFRLLRMPRAGIEPATRGFSVLCSTN